MIKPAKDKTEPVIKMEDVAGQFGFRIRYEIRDDAVGFMVWQIIGRQPDGLRLALFAAEGKDDLTPDVVAATPYLSGAIRSDGRVWFTGDAVFFGGVGARKDLGLRKHVFFRAYEEMDMDAKRAWEQEP